MFPVAAGQTAPSSAIIAGLSGMAALSAGSGGSYLKLSKAGILVYGKDGDTLDPADVLAINPLSFVIGWQGWENGKPQDGQVINLVSEAAKAPEDRTVMLNRSELPVLKAGEMNGWKEMQGCDMFIVGKKINLEFHTTSDGGRKFVSKLAKTITEGVAKHEDVPVCLINMFTDSYKHEDYGKIIVPDFSVVGWMTNDGEEVDVES